jgi:hypothetical protein
VTISDPEWTGIKVKLTVTMISQVDVDQNASMDENAAPTKMNTTNSRAGSKVAGMHGR